MLVPGFGSLTLCLAAASLAISAGGVWASIRFAHRAGVIDVPNERSSHAVPTSRMGGVPMVAAALTTSVPTVPVAPVTRMVSLIEFPFPF
mgnify:CR=1 FL=1